MIKATTPAIRSIAPSAAPIPIPAFAPVDKPVSLLAVPSEFALVSGSFVGPDDPALVLVLVAVPVPVVLTSVDLKLSWYIGALNVIVRSFVVSEPDEFVVVTISGNWSVPALISVPTQSPVGASVGASATEMHLLPQELVQA